MDQGGSVGSTLEEGTHHSGGRETVPLLVFRARYQKNTYILLYYCAMANCMDQLSLAFGHSVQM